MVGSGHMAGIAAEFDRPPLVCGARGSRTVSRDQLAAATLTPNCATERPRSGAGSSGGSAVARAMSGGAHHPSGAGSEFGEDAVRGSSAAHFRSMTLSRGSFHPLATPGADVVVILRRSFSSSCHLSSHLMRLASLVKRPDVRHRRRHGGWRRSSMSGLPPHRHNGCGGFVRPGGLSPAVWYLRTSARATW